MIFTDSQKTALLALIGQSPYTGKTQAQILALLNTPSIVPNPKPQPTIPAPFTVSQVFGLLSIGSKAKLNTVPFLPDIRDKIASNDRINCGIYVQLLSDGSTILPSEASAMMGLISAAQLDPTWAVNVAGPTPFQDLFSGVPFIISDGSVHTGNATPDMLVEVMS